jgi:hypothetical protein
MIVLPGERAFMVCAPTAPLSLVTNSPFVLMPTATFPWHSARRDGLTAHDRWIPPRLRGSKRGSLHELLKEIQARSTAYPTRQLMLLLGDDFRYETGDASHANPVVMRLTQLPW